MDDIKIIIEKLDLKLDELNQTMDEIIIMQAKIKKLLREEKKNNQDNLAWYLKNNNDNGYHSDGDIIKKSFYQIISDSNLVDIQEQSPNKKKFSLKKMIKK